ncbi:FG-GAP-like repeat-containing protein [Cytophaga hutchinsonii]|uniref:CHU large protein uncharacterized n=1 Tax=Cytophaga hutchinsonii (strain ATCC 33406 / DSM 1761 / CIP 103989 / NBRC 15051 / NCIMB 9469 / D465) TaxID=269798 RepID=A0A6N4SND3_CYTH3|nr:FG-GAP-like repeat-containing protein [Cytophaga hutchinsonii]ABG57817.1 CHU large protein; uncharacterized [Cytophaga hutchinsonii ATCC 33406]SFX06359.1 gliding motility-associated C-terminal domain-containing protein [Cytophaga hutchinsonii ATCC 33406]
MKPYNEILKQLVKNHLMLLAACVLLLLNAAETKAQTPHIDKIAPLSGDISKTIVTISGNNLVYKNLVPKVFFGTIPANIYSQSETEIKVTVPLGASYDHITVVVSPTGTAISEQFFQVLQASPCDFTTPQFNVAEIIATNTFTPVYHALADVNGDRKPDLLVLSDNSRISIYKNSSTPTNVNFEKFFETTLLTTAVPASLAVADLNTDGVMDIVVGYSAGNRITILPGTTGTSFGTAAHITVGFKNTVIPAQVAVTDIDDDGIMDIITGNSDPDESISIIQKNAFTGFDYSTKKTLSSSKGVTSLAIADVDLDGKKDIAFTYGGQGYYYASSEGFNKAFEISSVATNLVLAGNFSKNEKTDLILAHPGSLSAFREGNSYTFEDKNFKEAPVSFVGGDYNSDGNTDIAAVYMDEKSLNHIAFYTNDGSGNLQSYPSLLSTGFGEKTVIASGDINMDGQPDLIVFDQKKTYIYAYIKASSIVLGTSSISVATVCEATAAPVTLNNMEGTISWFKDSNGKDSIPGADRIIPKDYVAAPSTTLYARVSYGSCTSALSPVTFAVNAAPAVTASASYLNLCPGDSTTLTTTTTDAGTAYSWSPRFDIKKPDLATTNVTPKTLPVPLETAQNPTFPSEKMNVFTYTVTATKNGCSASSSVKINVYSFVASLIEKDSKDSICSGEQVVFQPAISNGTFSTYVWSNTSGLPNPANGAANAAVTPTNTTTAVQTVTYTIAGQTTAGCAVTRSKSVYIKPAPAITPSSLTRAIAGSGLYTQAFTVAGSTNPVFTVTGTLPNDFTFAGNTFRGTPAGTNVGSYTFSITASQAGKCSSTAPLTFVIEDLASPNLLMNPVYKNVGADAFYLQAVTQSTGSLSYKVKGATDLCLTIASNGLVDKITCRSTPDSIPVIVTQAATSKYRAATWESYIKISPNPNTTGQLNTAGITLNETNAKITVSTNSDVTPSKIVFVQLSNTDVANIKEDGTIIPFKEGTIAVEVRIPATLNYAAFSREYILTIHSTAQRPAIVSDTIVITIGQDTLINILANDYGVTSPIDPAKTDIDLENTGIQNKYYSLSMGNFLIDIHGNLEYRAFSGFLGEGKLAYTVTDSAGVRSETGYVYIIVKELLATPALKANEVMTPNNDGLNDGLVIAYANLHSASSLTIIDETGNIVYETSNYQNDWKGVDKKGDVLEPGVYFYVYEEEASGRALKQYIQIIK